MTTMTSTHPCPSPAQRDATSRPSLWERLRSAVQAQAWLHATLVGPAPRPRRRLGRPVWRTDPAQRAMDADLRRVGAELAYRAQQD
ncbi:MAG: hypothetical protein LWW86_10370 [Micrococcales bacterium]|nr:hypothetical protein [Micrococcales bacterium]